MPDTNFLSKVAQAALARVKVSSALDSCLYLCIVTIIVCIPASLWCDGGVRFFFLSIVGTPIAVFLGVFVYFAIKAPDKLRSEDYEIKKQALAIIETKNGAIPMSADSLHLIANPNADSSSEVNRGNK